MTTCDTLGGGLTMLCCDYETLYAHEDITGQDKVSTNSKDVKVVGRGWYEIEILVFWFLELIVVVYIFVCF